MKTVFFLMTVMVVASIPDAPLAQERKPVPKDSVRVFIPGCSKGYMFTAGHPSEDQPGGAAVPEGMHLRMNAPKSMMADIKGHEGSMLEITGLIKKGQFAQDGIGIGRGVRVTGGSSPTDPGLTRSAAGASPLMIDVEGWRRIAGECPR
jgi:hypothetical protein